MLPYLRRTEDEMQSGSAAYAGSASFVGQGADSFEPAARSVDSAKHAAVAVVVNQADTPSAKPWR